ncbi:hypothetical protein [Sporosarcina cyprini]|uniref:hypothetical protein n=1 Tax=Sporosarcina cyprini TaxID=2910523 RepID=UPI001EDFE5D2|nr:hypothetical protein [Sporosarcina cyprini]MCG3088281.1 hypothetical protein [Sporosarcina cyprini]
MKKKFVILFSIIFLASAGTIYANINSAQMISQWYEKSFKEKSESVGAETATALIRMLSEHRMFVKEMNTALETAIAVHRDRTTGDTTTGIEDYKNALIRDMNTTSDELKKETFEEYVTNRNIEEEIQLEFESILQEVLSE